MDMISVAIIQYPGTNCEYETARAVVSCGMMAEIFRWNMDPERLSRFDGYIIPGGFSYQDRVRAGAIASKKSIIERLVKEVEAGKPLLGICNGAQILVEAGIVPGLDHGEIQMALGPNMMEGRDGYYCDWILVRIERNNSIFTMAFDEMEIIPLPIAHTEGRFITSKDILERIIQGGQAVLRYCTIDGEIIEGFPVNPNGSIFNLAGVSNPRGNVLAMMPHPERANFIRQIPDTLRGKWAKLRFEAWGDPYGMEAPGPGRGIFLSMKRYIEGRCGSLL